MGCNGKPDCLSYGCSIMFMGLKSCCDENINNNPKYTVMTSVVRQAGQPPLFTCGPYVEVDVNSVLRKDAGALMHTKGGKH
ncbi:hypothetical protein PAMP_012416 [Pampus punctatissimus]